MMELSPTQEETALDTLAEARIQAVRGHMRLESEGDCDAVIAIGAGGDGVLVEFWLTSTRPGPLRTPDGVIAPTRGIV